MFYRSLAVALVSVAMGQAQTPGPANRTPSTPKTKSKKQPAAVAVAPLQPIDPQGAQAFYRRGIELEQERDYAGAIEAFSDAWRLDSSLDGALLHRALGYWYHDEYPRAASDIAAYLSIDSENGRAREAIIAALRRGELVLSDFASYAVTSPGQTKQGRFFRNAPETMVADTKLPSGVALPDPRELELSKPEIVPVPELAVPELAVIDAPPDVGAESATAPVEIAMVLPLVEIPASPETEKQNPEDARYYMRLARLHASEGDFEKAVKSYDEVLRLQPNYPLALNGRGYALLRLRDYERAAADFSRAIDLNPMYANAYQNRAVVRRRLGDRAGAKDDEQTAVGLDLKAK